ncbi:glycosyltransferase family 2 protein [Massilia eburnea]|uniref:glycosyltransferase family 2 protein n=1 Tax=Massilia eburnea TaxID=1776165 RepID=UPI0035309B07
MDQLNAKNVGGPAKVAILLGTYNGQQYLAEQLDSFAIQTHDNWAVWASDDGSSDATRTILEGYQSKWPAGRLSLLSGPKAGFEANFLALICNKNIEADYYAYSDQDDIWEAEKLERAVHWLKSVPSDMPALYCGRTRLVDGDNKEIGLSPLFSRPPCFANALIQSIAGGNTMVFNQAARALMQVAGQQCSIITHDWWTYMVVTGCGGKVFYDEVPTLRYRQHGANVIGMNDGWRARFKRLGMQWQGRFRIWNNVHIEALGRLDSRLTAENREILRQFVAARKMSLLPRLFNLNRSGVHRQTRLGNIGLLAAAIFNKV